MPYQHGTYGEFAKSVSKNATNSPTVAVYVGCLPVNLVKDYADADVVNKPVLLSSMADVYSKVGYSPDWAKFSLCEACNLHFNNRSGNTGPIVVINVLDPTVDKNASSTTKTISFINGRATIESDTIILDTLALKDKVEDTDYKVTYDFTAKKVIIDSIGDKITGDIEATYDEVDVSVIDDGTIIGESTEDGEYSGLGAIELVYQQLGLIPNLIVAPGWSEIPNVYEKMIAAGTKINGHWDAFVIADIPLTDDTGSIDTIKKATDWAENNAYNNERSKVCWPCAVGHDKNIYHASTLYAWRMVLVDASHDGVPMETPSNKSVPVVKQYFGSDSTNLGFDQVKANELNAKGISTVVFFGGQWVLWGGHTAAYKYGSVTDNRVIFDNNVRMMMYISNSFQAEWATVIDAPMTLAMADTIKQREQEKADALVAIGALIGTPIIEFERTSNDETNLIEGNFIWDFEATPTPQLKSATLRVAYSTAGFDTFFGEEA